MPNGGAVDPTYQYSLSSHGHICSVFASSKDWADQKTIPSCPSFGAHGGNGLLCELHPDYVTLSKQNVTLSSPDLSFDSWFQSNAIINEDHKQVMAFILPKLRVQKTSFRREQCWLSIGSFLGNRIWLADRTSHGLLTNSSSGSVRFYCFIIVKREYKSLKMLKERHE